MGRRVLSLVVLLSLVCASLTVAAAPARSSCGEHAALYSRDCGCIQLRSTDELSSSYTIYVRAAPCIYLPVRNGDVAPYSQIAVSVPQPGAGDGALYVITFTNGGKLALFHPDEWGWDF